MKVFLDANVIIDVVLNRTDFIDISSKVLQLGLDGQCDYALPTSLLQRFPFMLARTAP